MCAVALAVGASASQGRAQSDQGYTPPKGFVPDAATAVRVSEAVLTPVYGDEQVSRERPMTAVLHGEVWTVQGHLPHGVVGGVAQVQISKIDARIIRMSHGR